MSDREYRSRHLLAIIITSGIISTAVAIALVSARIGVITLPPIPEIPEISSIMSTLSIPEISIPFMEKKEPSLNQLFDRGKPKDALEIISKQPEHIQKSDTSLFMQGKAWYLIAWQRFESENWSNYAKNPNDWFEGDDVDKALYLLQKSAQSANTWAQATTMMGIIYMEKGWYAKAKSAFQSVITKDVNERDAYIYYGVILSRMNEHERAIRHLENWNYYRKDYEFLKNLFYLYLFNVRNYEKAAVLGDLYLKLAPRSDPGFNQITRELNDLSSRFPEYFNDTMVIIRDRLPEFRQRKR